ncbi:N4-gp56 family major capsid protein [Marinobacterium litorale]|uniref:N4-gp56 family major capsid protein n=1 Tax=Marinobacterium litorale TaxID=404770 RepID=UPI000424DCE2|nr:N4-gp56 family major capsid protein [Marinobacterium litorale]
MTQQIYNDPAGGQPSTIGPQMNTFYYQKKALIEAKKEQYFGQLADVTSMPKHFGKKIKKYHYLPLLDDRNINDQGIDAAGVTITTDQYYVTLPRNVLSVANASKAAAATAIADNLDGVTAVAGADDSAGTGFATITVTGSTHFKVATLAKATAIADLGVGAVIQQGSGNLYGSSKDVGTIASKMPALSETGGRVNRVGFTRVEIEGTLEKFGFFDEYTKESLDFDTDSELAMHVNREMVMGANEITEDALQIDLLNSAGVIRYAGAATENAEIDDTCEVTYGDLMRLSIDLDNNRTPKHTKVITGTRMIDTKTIPACRVMYVGSELLPLLQGMKDLHNDKAFIAVQHYAAAGETLTGEVGAVGDFRIVVVPEMMHWEGAGADASGTATHHETGDRYNVYPMLVVGDSSFTTIGFQTDGKTVKFKIKHSKPESPESYANDPYGETGFMSIKWYYGFMVYRPERIALVKTAAPL